MFPSGYEDYEINVRRYKWNEYKQYLEEKKARLRNFDFSIISSNCNGAFMYYDLGLPYLSPTVNLTIGMNDFIKMVKNLKYYMALKMKELEGNYAYPTGILGDIKVNFVHYKTFEEGFKKWEERKKRINWDNLFIVGTERGDCDYETIKCFEQLPYKNKICFTHIEYPEFKSAYYIKGFEEQGQLGILVDYKKQFLLRRYLDDFDYLDFLNN